MKISNNQIANNFTVLVFLIPFILLNLLLLLSTSGCHVWASDTRRGQSTSGWAPPTAPNPYDWRPLVGNWQRPSHHSSAKILSQDHVILDHSKRRHHLSTRNLIHQATRSDSDNVETFYIRKGANGSLPCLPVLPGDSQSTLNKIEWYKEDKKLVEAEKRHIVVWNTKNSIAYLPETGALFFRGVTSEDSGEYQCILTKTTSTGESEAGVVRFYVQDVPDPPQMPIVTGFTQRSVNLSWVPSYDYHFSPILHYVIHVREGVEGAWDVANGIMTPDNRTQYEIIGLKPFTTYSFRVLAVNAIGVGDPSPVSHYIITLRQKPDSRLTIISAKNISSNAIKLEWLPPSTKEIHGEFVGYKIRYVHQLHEHAPPAPSSSSDNSSSSLNRFDMATYNNQHHNQPTRPSQSPTLDSPLAKEISVGDTQLTSYVIKGLQTFTPYKISVQVTNPAGDGPVAEVLAMTDEGVASPPLDLTVLKATDTSVKLRWSEPKSPNGILQGYQITLHDIGNNQNDTRKLSDPQSIMEHTLGELVPYTWYLVTIQAYSRKYLGEPSQSVKFRTDVSAPSAPHLINVTCYSLDSILIQWQRPDNYYNQIDYYYVKYKPDSSWEKEEETTLLAKKDKLLNELMITNLTAEQLYELKVLAGTRSIHDPNYIYRSEPSQTFRVVLQANCESYTAYPITENTFNTSLLIGVVSASFALALVTFLLIYWRRHCQAAYYYLDEPQDASRGTNSPQLSETYDDTEYGSIPVNDWAKHVQKLHADSDIGFSREFEQVAGHGNASKNLLSMASEYSNLPENKPKNRYTNIVAYDHTRVVLRPPLGGTKKPGFDYINANFIDGYNKPRAYIGTQGPLVSTFDDYWRMIWEQRVVIIVMITNLQERGRRKCDLYWPKEGTETYGYIQVKLLQEVVMATYTLRTFTVKNLKLKKRTGSERTVYQYHYTNWPDHGVPDHPLPVLSFVRKSAAANPPAGGAIICHCSAGCGRSGTYIVIDAMLKQIRHRQSINVVDFLKHIRAQRNFLVQTEEQYIFIHDALVEAIESGETEIPSNLIGKYIQLLQTGTAGKSCVGSGSNYSLTNGLTGGGGGGLLNSCRQSPNSLSVATGTTTGNEPLVATSPTGNNNNNNLLPGLANGRASANTVSRSSSSNNQAGQQQWSLLERQYRLVASFKAKDFCVVSALKPCNKIKNRTLNLIPLEAHRVHITPKPGQDGSDYINATFLMGFNHLREFIVTQHPVYETYSDFWQMVYDHNSQTIVLLTQMTQTGANSTNAGATATGSDDGSGGAAAKDYGQFWPQKEDEVDYGSFKVKLTKESSVLAGTDANNNNLIVTRDFIMRSNQDDYELQTRIIHCPGWPDCCGSLSAVFDLIQVVQQASQQQASQQQMHDRHNGQLSQTVTIGQEHEPQNGGPVIVVDKFGGTEAATFSVLTTLFKQINFEDAVDVYMYAKLAHLRRPGIWSSQDDYLFLYRAMEQYASNLAAQQHQQQQQVADKQAAHLVAAAPPPMAHHHHQTMTLDRHRHKSASALKNTSTMARKHHHHHNNHHQQQPQQVVVAQFGGGGAQHQQNLQLGASNMSASSDLLSKSNTQLASGGGHHQAMLMPAVMMDANHNNIPYSSATIATNHNIAKNQQHLLMMQHQQQQQQQQQQQPAQQLMMAKGSPYNSAASIGAGSHQHLLAGQTPRAANLHHQQQQLVTGVAPNNNNNNLYSVQ